MAVCPTALFHNIQKSLYRHFGDDIYNEISSCTRGQSRLAAAQLLVSETFKRFADTRDNTACDEAAFRKWSEVNDRVGSYVPEPKNWFQGEFLTRFKGNLQKHTANIFAVTSDPTTICKYGGWGNGANVGASGTTFYNKMFASTLTATSKYLIELFTGFQSAWRSAHEAEKLRSCKLGASVTKSGKACFIVKNDKISRLIMTEPTLNTFFQKGVDFVIRAYLLFAFCIDMRTVADDNRSMALNGSKSGLFATCDESSASDSISLRLVRDNMDKGFACQLETFATRWITFDEPFFKGSIHMNMISSMGNGWTSSLQTLVFLSVVETVYEIIGEQMIRTTDGTKRNYSVFGDDIIVVTRAFPYLVEALQLLGFVVNTDKSFSSGLFRESCGVDAFDGVNIRAVYCMTLTKPRLVCDYVNRLLRWSVRHDIPMTELILWLMREYGLHFVPYSASDTDGVRVVQSTSAYLKMVRVPIKERKLVGMEYGYHYYRYEPVTSVIRGRFLLASRNDFGYLHGVLVNPLGLYCSALANKFNSTGLPRRGFTMRWERISTYVTDWNLGFCLDDPSNKILEDIDAAPMVRKGRPSFNPENNVHGVERRSCFSSRAELNRFTVASQALLAFFFSS